MQYFLRQGAAAEIHKAVTDKTYGGDILLTDTSPSIMLGHRGVKNLPMVMKASHIRENILTKEEAANLGLSTDPRINYHGLGENLFKEVIESLDDITVAYRGTAKASNPSRRENSFLLLSTVKHNGNTIVVPVYINETGMYNEVYIETNKIASVYGKESVNDYIRREIDKGNLVRIKKRGPISSESPAPIAVDYADVTSAEEAADQAAMASYGNNIQQKAADVKSFSENNSEIDAENTVQQQRRTRIYSDREVLQFAADIVDTRSLTDGERDALRIFNERLNNLNELNERLEEQRRIYAEQKAAETPDEGEMRKTLNRLQVLGKKVKAAENLVLSIENKPVFKKILKEARNVVEHEQRSIRDDKAAREKYRKQIQETVKTLSEWLLKNSDKEHVPEICSGRRHERRRKHRTDPDGDE